LDFVDLWISWILWISIFRQTRPDLPWEAARLVIASANRNIPILRNVRVPARANVLAKCTQQLNPFAAARGDADKTAMRPFAGLLLTFEDLLFLQLFRY